jgi:D-glycero-D-manno-heptose 1,7-bisphosphate phosphatase
MKLVMLERDGVLNEDRAGHVKHPGELSLIAGAGEACARLNRAGIKIAIVSNQPAVGLGMMSLEMLERVNDRLRDAIWSQGGRIDLWLSCCDRPGTHSLRLKPAPGMLREALAQFRLTREDAVMIGAQLADLEAARAAGMARILVRTGKGAQLLAQGLKQDILPVSVYDSLHAAVESLLAPPRGT